VAAGYTNLCFFSGFDSASEITTNRSGAVTAKWYTQSGLSYTIANSVITLRNTVSPGNNADVSSVANSGAVLTQPGAIRAGNGNGLRFRYGTFEALQRFSPLGNVVGQAWIAWWASDFNRNWLGDTSNPGLELDFLEVFQPGNPSESSTGLWQWQSPKFATSGWGDAPYLVSQSTANAACDNFADWFIVGGTVTPQYVEVYFNSKARRARGVADTTIWRVDTHLTYNTSIGPAVYSATTLPSYSMDLLFGGSNPGANIYEFDYIVGWQ
jgi:hypothetical protein